MCVIYFLDDACLRGFDNLVRRSVGPSVHQSVGPSVPRSLGPSVPRSVDRTNRYPKLTSKRHTDLRSCVSEAKFVKESDFDVKSRLAPPKSTEIDEKHDSDTENFSNFNFAKAGAPPVPSCTAVRPGPSLGKIKICQVFRTNEQTTNEQK